jgi:hypothetical protein
VSLSSFKKFDGNALIAAFLTASDGFNDFRVFTTAAKLIISVGFLIDA